MGPSDRRERPKHWLQNGSLVESVGDVSAYWASAYWAPGHRVSGNWGVEALRSFNATYSYQVLTVSLMSLLTVAVVGCGAGPEFPMEEVRGMVTFQDKPLPGGTVVLHPTSGTPGPQAFGQIERDGTFRMKTVGVFGAAVGEHRVTVDYRRELTDIEAQNLVIPNLLIPPKYARVDETPLRFTVEEGEDNTLDILLED